MEKRHAYLIMAHHRPDLLQRLINAIDDKRNDIFIHIDKKSNMNESAFSVENAGLYFIERMDVRWAGYTQIECELKLLEAALHKGDHEYYHLLTGATYPLRNQDYIHDFFENHRGTEFVGFDNKQDYSQRAKYYYFMSEYGKPKGIYGKLIYHIRSLLLGMQRLLGCDRLKGSDMTVKKGIAYWSITQELAEYIVDKRDWIGRAFKHTLCCDEVFVHTLVYNSEFYKRVYDAESETRGSGRISTWGLAEESDDYNFVGQTALGLEAADAVLGSDSLFAFKFEGEDGLKLIDFIDSERNIV